MSPFVPGLRCRTLIDAFRNHLDHRPQDVWLSFQKDDETTHITFDGLISRAAGYAAALRAGGAKPGDLTFIVLEHRPDLCFAFVGAMIAGCTPAILAPLSEKQDPTLYWDTMRRLFESSRAAFAFVEPSALADVRDVASAVPEMTFLTPFDGAMPSSDIAWPDPRPTDTALMQFSSGTTGLRKGVMLTHHEIMSQIRTYGDHLALEPGDRIASWLPLYHDMGLIACFVLPLVTGLPLRLIDPLEWVYEPQMLFEAITSDKATFVWMPNFAFGHLTRSVRKAAGYDLSSVRAFINCSEPCKFNTMKAFVDRFSAIGVRLDQMQTCYAMAEAVFAVTQSRLGTPLITLRLSQSDLVMDTVKEAAVGEPFVELTSVGEPLLGFEIRVVGRDRQELPADRLGEIAIRGLSTFSGYYGSPDATADSFSGEWFLTGDLGFLRAGQLYVTGRLKDVIISYGKNYYCHDIEAIVNEIAAVKPGRAVAFGLYNEVAGSEEVVIVAEVGEETEDHRQVAIVIKERVLASLNLAVSKVELVEPKWLVKTSSGKISRSMNKQKYVLTRRISG